MLRSGGSHGGACYANQRKYYLIFTVIQTILKYFTMLWCNFESASQERLSTLSMSKISRFQFSDRATCTVILSKWWVHFSLFYVLFPIVFLSASKSCKFVATRIIYSTYLANLALIYAENPNT